MIKKIIVCVIATAVLLLTACAEQKAFPPDVTCKQILDAAKTAVGTLLQTEEEYIKGEDDFDSYDMSLWADSLFEECEEYKLLDDYALYYSGDNTTYEITVLKAKNSDDTQKLVALLERRKETLFGGNKAAYDPNFKSLMNNSRILTEDSFVILLITPDNDKAITAIENLKQ
ncbi:MAG: DUF4358 domain-containing protein [Clostridia bacterium]|nr:DUF4358 domain-containing protein [Clostridia bacterium]